jgi:L-threonylcarbamoyladenylate synthase
MAIVTSSPSVISRAAQLLRAGELVAFPTETVYGLGAHALDERAVRRIFDAKGRPSHNPVIVHVAAPDDARQVVAAWPPTAERLAERFWPGPLTLVLPKRSSVPGIVTAGLDSVAVRVPAHPVALALLREAGIPVAAPSANRSTELSPTTALHVEKSLGDRVALIVDGGPTTVGIESTVVDLSDAIPVVLRAGAIAAEDLATVVGAVARSAAQLPGSAAARSPGMMDRHYAPRAALFLFDPPDAQSVEQARRRAREESARGGRVALLVRTEGLPVDVHDVVVMPQTADAYARRLYAVLHELDDAGCSLILVERVPPAGEWAAIADRLERGSR